LQLFAYICTVLVEPPVTPPLIFLHGLNHALKKLYKKNRL